MLKITKLTLTLAYTNCQLHRRSQGGCSGCTCTPQGGEKNFFRPNLQEKCESAPPQDTKCTPQPEQESIFRSFCWVVKKCTPADKILATPMSLTDVISTLLRIGDYVTYVTYALLLPAEHHVSSAAVSIFLYSRVCCSYFSTCLIRRLLVALYCQCNE